MPLSEYILRVVSWCAGVGVELAANAARRSLISAALRCAPSPIPGLPQKRFLIVNGGLGCEAVPFFMALHENGSLFKGQ
jgi:hypothetical protein